MGCKHNNAIIKNIKGYDGIYNICEYGCIISLPRNGTIKKEKVLTPKVEKNGYHRIVLYDKTNKTLMIHRLVAEVFIENKYNKPCIDHIDCNKSNNHFTNLRWVTYKENNNYSWDNNRCNTFGETHWLSVLKNNDIKYIRKLSKLGYSSKNIAKKLNNIVSDRTVRDIVNHKTWKHI